VLIFVAPWRRRFAILGDEAVNGRVAPDFWRGLADDLGRAFRAGDATGGLARAIAAIGDQLARHFPAQGNENPNELPDTVAVPGRRDRR
jgi:putative membrane protein